MNPPRRRIGVREAAIGVALVVQPGPGALVCRTAADPSDAVITWRHDHRMAAGPTVFGPVALGLAASTASTRP